MKGCLFLAFNGGTAIAQLFHIVASSGGMLVMDIGCGYYNVTAIGDTGTKAQVYVSGVTATNAGGKGIVAT